MVPAVVVPPVVVPPVVVPHDGRVMVLVSSVTEALRARARPVRVAPVFRPVDCSDMMVPTKLVSVPSVAELPTCQKTLQGEAPLIRTTLLADAVVRVEPIWKIHTALGSPAASRVSVPVSPMEDDAL